MKFVLRPRYSFDMNVLEAARTRIRWLWDEFDGQVTVNTSGGKDSTVVMELAAEVARERGKKLHVMWLDQECEFEATYNYQKYVAQRPDIEFDWYQIPFRENNSTNSEYPWLHVWGEGEEWVREKEPDSIQVNDFRDPKGRVIDRFSAVLDAINRRNGGALLSGMRMEESPARYVTLMGTPSYKWVTWSANKGKLDEQGKPYFVFSPIYDWSYRDVWKYIHDCNLVYNDYYNIQFRYGVPITKMRVSCYHHEQALSSLNWLQEVEPETWEKATRRLQGISTQGHIGGYHELIGDKLPYMFKDWHEYMAHLIDNLIADPKHRASYYEQEQKMLKSLPESDPEWVSKIVCKSVLKNDYHGQYVGQAILTAKNAMGRAQYTKRVVAGA